MLRFREILKDDTSFYVPHVFSNLSSKCVLTMEYVDGKPVDACINEPQEVRDYIAGKFIELCLKELFLWRFMQVTIDILKLIKKFSRQILTGRISSLVNIR
jgi:aarF domain-containing kinase